MASRGGKKDTSWGSRKAPHVSPVSWPLTWWLSEGWSTLGRPQWSCMASSRSHQATGPSTALHHWKGFFSQIWSRWEWRIGKIGPRRSQSAPWLAFLLKENRDVHEKLEESSGNTLGVQCARSTLWVFNPKLESHCHCLIGGSLD